MHRRPQAPALFAVKKDGLPKRRARQGEANEARGKEKPALE
jgi:hypothetical protein